MELTWIVEDYLKARESKSKGSHQRGRQGVSFISKLGFGAIGALVFVQQRQAIMDLQTEE